MSAPSAFGLREPRVVGRYILYDEIASGGMATVHVGRLVGPAGFTRTVAIKRLHPQFAKDPEFVSMFLDEARLAARIRHPNVVSTLDVVALEGELFLVMEYVQGESLARLLRACQIDQRRIPPRVASAIVVSALLGLHAAHEATSERGEALGIVHRDVSPQNVLVGADGVARVVDFGVAKAASRLHTTEEGKIKGKLAYMAPEQLRHEKVDRRTDVFAASIVLWEALVGERLFQAQDAAAVVTKILGSSPDPVSQRVPGLSAAVDAVVARGLSQHPSERFSTAREMAQALEAALPPASPLEVGAFVESVASEVLRARSEVVAEVESISTEGPSLEVLVSAMKGSPARASLASLTPAGGTDLSAAAAPSPKASGVGKRAAVALIALLGIASAVFFWLGRSKSSVAESARVETPARTGAEPASSVAPASSIPPSSIPASSTPSPEASVAPAPAAEPAPAPSAKPASRPAAQSKPKQPRANCDPPYVLNADGSKRFKPECF
ncbi:MAG: serine/threonine-protein kinase [Polyangiaceae bacterium]